VLNVLVAQSMGLLLGVAFMNPKTAQVSSRAAGVAGGSIPPEDSLLFCYVVMNTLRCA
jgi:hypothetical protein